MCSVVWLVYLCLTVVHLYANYRAVTAVTMDTLNQSRLHAVIHHWLTHRQVLSVSEANRREPVLSGSLSLSLSLSLSFCVCLCLCVRLAEWS